MEHKKTICFDFDGVIHSYTSGWKGADVIPDPPVEGAIEGLYRLTADPEIDVAIHSSRSAQPGGIEAMKRWLRQHEVTYLRELDEKGIATMGMNILDRVRFPKDKPPAVAYVDDRGINFDGDWSKITTELKDFTPWNKQ